MKGSATNRRSERAVSEIVGLILLFGLVIMSSGIVFLTAMSAQEEVSERNRVAATTTSMQEVRSTLGSLAREGNDASASLRVGESAGNVTVANDGTLEFVVNDHHGTCETRMDVGTLLSRPADDTTVGYQAGGVWKWTDGGANMVSPPSLEYRTTSMGRHTAFALEFPMIDVQGEVSGGDGVRARKDVDAAANRRRQIRRDLCLAGPNTGLISDDDGDRRLRNVSIFLRGNTFYEAWARYFQTEFRGLGTVIVFDHNDSVRVDDVPLGMTLENPMIKGGIYATGANGELYVKNEFLGDSYDSTSGPYSASQSEDGRIVTAGDLYTQGQARIEGDAIAGGDASMDGQSEVTNLLAADGTITISGSASAGATADNASVPQVPDVTDEVRANVSRLRHSNDNDIAGAISDNRTALGADGTGELQSGEYYLDGLTLDNEKLVFNTSRGDVVVAVDGDMSVQRASNITVVGEGTVLLYLTGDLTHGGTTEMAIPNDDAGQFWVVGTNETDGTFTSKSKSTQSEFVGVFYAASPDDRNRVDIDNAANVYGAVIASRAEARNHAEVHYDEAVRNALVPNANELVTAYGGGSVDGNEVTGPNGENVVSFDSKVTVMGTELSALWESEDLIINNPITAVLRLSNDRWASSRTYTPWPDGRPNDDLSGLMDDDINHPTVDEELTHTFSGLPPGTRFTVRGTSYHCKDQPYSFNYTDTGVDETVDGSVYDDYACKRLGDRWIDVDVASDSDVEKVKILTDGDEVPNVDAGGDEQRSLKDMLGPKINASGYLELDPGEFVFLFELSNESATWSTALNKDDDGDPDYNDMVVLYEITNIERENDDTSYGPADRTPDNGFVLKISNDQVILEEDD